MEFQKSGLTVFFSQWLSLLLGLIFKPRQILLLRTFFSFNGFILIFISRALFLNVFFLNTCEKNTFWYVLNQKVFFFNTKWLKIHYIYTTTLFKTVPNKNPISFL